MGKLTPSHQLIEEMMSTIGATTSHIQVDSLSVGFKTIQDGKKGWLTVADELNIDFAKGEFTCIIGPSGCGKSTLLRVIAGLEKASDGSVLIDGERVTSPRQDVGVVFQHFNLLPWKTVAGNVSFGLQGRGLSSEERQRRIRRCIQSVGLNDFADSYPAQLSGGMQQRVGLARALAIEPDLFLMDEPFGSLDALSRMAMQTELVNIWQENPGKTVVFITHDIDEAIYLGDRILVMSPRPGSIQLDMRVPYDRPRDESLRGRADFAQLKERLWEALSAADSRDAFPNASARKRALT